MEILKTLAAIIISIVLLIIHCRWMKRREDELFPPAADPEGELD